MRPLRSESDGERAADSHLQGVRQQPPVQAPRAGASRGTTDALGSHCRCCDTGLLLESCSEGWFVVKAIVIALDVLFAALLICALFWVGARISLRRERVVHSRAPAVSPLFVVLGFVSIYIHSFTKHIRAFCNMSGCSHLERVSASRWDSSARSLLHALGAYLLWCLGQRSLLHAKMQVRISPCVSFEMMRARLHEPGLVLRLCRDCPVHP